MAQLYPSSEWIADAIFGDPRPHLRRALETCGYPIPPIRDVRVAIDFARTPPACIASWVQADHRGFRVLSNWRVS